MKISVVIGTRPEAIKLAPVVLACRQQGVRATIVLTGQHREMVAQVFRAFGLRAHHDLRLMKTGQTLEYVAARALERLPGVWRRDRPDAVVVQGDTTTAFAAALAAYYQRIPVAHVEAGLRTFRKYAPFPEEGNRVLIDHLAEWHFASTPGAARHLRREGIHAASIVVTGNTGIDALLHIKGKAGSFHDPVLRRLAWRRVLLVTMHRREHWGRPLAQVCGAIRRLLERHRDLEVVLPVHPNPHVRKMVREELGRASRVALTPPLAYPDFVRAMARAHLILTDSGGVQEEAPYLGVPVLVFRQATERPEAVAAGACRVVGFDPNRVVREVERLLGSPRKYRKMARVRRPFGDGKASDRIVRHLKRTFRPA